MKDFERMSKYAGMREDLVQAGGGNSAYKITSDKMAIKASGYQLADITEKNGYAIVNPKIIRDAFLNCADLGAMTEEESREILSEAYIEGARPSIETFLHAISGRYSLHTHPIVVNALACRKNGEEQLKRLFPDSLVVPYATPGVQLAKAYFKAYKAYMKKNNAEPEFVFLMNHGFLVSGETADEVIALTEKVTSKIEKFLNVDYIEYHNMSLVQSLYGDGIIWKVTDVNIIHAYEKLNGLWDHAFCPDCVVFLGKSMYITTDITDKAKFTNFVAKNGYPTVIDVNGELYIHANSVKKALETQSVLSSSAQVMLLNKDEECEMLSEEERNFLLNWDAEKYRKCLK